MSDQVLETGKKKAKIEIELEPSRLSRLKGWLRKNRKPLLTVLLILFSFLGGGVYSFLVRRYSLPIISPLDFLSGKPVIALASKTVLDKRHPISGVFYSEGQRNIWSKRRPLAVMIDNHALARPYQFGLQEADLIWEAVAEGGITRFLAIFHGNNVAKLGAVRSSRVYYIDWALEFPAYYSHIGGAGTPGSPANIFVYIIQKEVLDLDQFRLGEATYWSGGDVITPGGMILSHVKFTSTGKLWQAGELLYPGTNKLPKFKVWKFKADAPLNKRPKKQAVSFNFWYLLEYEVKWKYDRVTNSYLRWQGGRKHLDQVTKKQLAAKNVVLLYTWQRSAGDGTSHLLHDTTGSGDAIVFLDGKKIKATWRRSSLSNRTVFYRRGTKKEISLNRGLTWIEVLPKGF